MKIIALYNIKGGVGKTTAAVNLAYLAARAGHSTLLCDLDAQGSASFYFDAPATKRHTANTLIEGGKKLIREIQPTPYEHLDILPASLAYRSLELSLNESKRSKKRLRDALKTLPGDYEYVFIDAPPSLNLLAENIFKAADVVLSPIVPTPLSLHSFEQLVDFLKAKKVSSLSLAAFFSMVETRKRIHRDFIAKISQESSFITPIRVPASAIIERMGIERRPLPAYAPKSTGARAYEKLWEYVRESLAPAEPSDNPWFYGKAKS